MLITKANLDALRTTFSLAFQQAYDNAESWASKIATEVPSNTRSNTYGWLAQQMRLREWSGPRIAMNLAEHRAELINKPYEGTVEIDRDEIEDDSLGIYQTVTMPMLGQAAKKHPDQLIVQLLQSNGGAGPTMYDGKALFADDHPDFNAASPGTYDNNFGLALTADNFNTVWSTMASYIGENGQPLGINPKTLLVPPQLKLTAHKIMQSATYAQPVMNVAGNQNVGAATIDNVMQGWAEVVVLEELALDPTTWYLADTSKPIKPLINQVRRAPSFVSRVNPDDPKVFDSKKFTYGVEYRCAVGASLPFLIARSKP